MSAILCLQGSPKELISVLKCLGKKAQKPCYRFNLSACPYLRRQPEMYEVAAKVFKLNPYLLGAMKRRGLLKVPQVKGAGRMSIYQLFGKQSHERPSSATDPITDTLMYLFTLKDSEGENWNKSKREVLELREWYFSTFPTIYEVYDYVSDIIEVFHADVNLFGPIVKTIKEAIPELL